MSVEKTVRFELSELYVGQIFDGLEVLAEQWEQTAKFMGEDLHVTAEETCIRECRDQQEAASIARLYRRIYRELQSQL